MFDVRAFDSNEITLPTLAALKGPQDCGRADGRRIYQQKELYAQRTLHLFISTTRRSHLIEISQHEDCQ